MADGEGRGCRFGEVGLLADVEPRAPQPLVVTIAERVEPEGPAIARDQAVDHRPGGGDVGGEMRDILEIRHRIRRPRAALAVRMAVHASNAPRMVTAQREG